MATTGWEGRPWLHSHRSPTTATGTDAANCSSGHAQLTNNTTITSHPLLINNTPNRTSSFAATPLPRPLTGARGSTAFTFVSYNVTSDVQCTKYRHTASRSWALRRRTTLINEIASYNAEILALQNVDHFYDWWRPQLALLGYDTVAKHATQRKGHRDDCVLVAYKRHLFQLFKSWDVELNESRKTTEDRNLVERVRIPPPGSAPLTSRRHPSPPPHHHHSPPSPCPFPPSLADPLSPRWRPTTWASSP